MINKSNSIFFLSIFIITGLIVLHGTSSISAGQGKRKHSANSGRQRQTQNNAEAWRKYPPKPAPASPFHLPALREVKLDNGLTLVLIENHRVPMVSMSLGIPVGGVNDPANQTGLNEAVAALLNDGAGNRSSLQLARAIETLGGQLSISVNDDYTEIYSSVIAENLDAMLDLFGDIILHPTFPEEEVALYKKNRVEGLKVQRQEPAFLLSERFNRAIYDAHPYGITAPTPEVIETLDRAKIENFYKSYYAPNGSTLVITGDFDAVKMEAQLRTMFGGWKSASILGQKLPDLIEQTKRRIYLIDRPNSEQADFRIGNLAIARSDKDYFALLVANAILGDGTGSRLFLNIREKRGYTYDVSSSAHAPRMRGTFFSSSETRNEVTVPAIREILLEFDRIRNEKVSEKDLQNAKNYLNGGFSLSLSTQGGVTNAMVQARMLGLAPDYLEQYRERIAAVTAEQVQAVARKYIRTDTPTIVIVGDAEKLRKPLATLGAIEIYDVEGKRKN